VPLRYAKEIGVLRSTIGKNHPFLLSLSLFALRLILRSTIEGIVEKRVQEQQEQEQEQEQASAQTQHEDLLKYMLRANQEDDSKVTKVLDTSLSLPSFLCLSACLPQLTRRSRRPAWRTTC
jgi:flagellar biosynthesis protein FliP